MPSVFTDTGAPSTGEEALAGLEHPVVKLLVEYRGGSKMLSTYAGWDLERVKDLKKRKKLEKEDSGWVQFMVGEYLYLSTKIHGTVTGRFSSRLHQVPRDGTIRNLISAPPGWTHVQADLSQAELRVVAIVSGDPELIQCYKDETDVHWRTAINNIRLGAGGDLLKLANETIAKWTLGDLPTHVSDICDLLEKIGHEKAIELNKAWKEIRKQAKGINFGYVYGMGARKFVEYAKVKYGWDITVSEAETIRNAFFATYSFLTSWHERQRALVKLDGYVRNLAGRIRRLPGIHSPDGSLRAECERQAINAPVQGFIGDYKTMAMLAVAEGIPDRNKLRIKGEVHDSVLLWIRTEFLDEILPQVKFLMENPPLIPELNIVLPVPIKVDIEVGDWGAGQNWKGA
jgi:DNA polymerase-1